MKSGVYIITNLINGKNYIGESYYMIKRLGQHRNSLINKKHPNRHLQGAWNKYGQEAFSFSILEQCSEDRQKELEDYWCRILRTHNDDFGYNIRLTDKAILGGISEKSKKLMSIAHKGKVLSDSHRENMRRAQLRRGCNQYRSPEAKLKIANANITRAKAVLQFSRDGIFIKEWRSRKEAAKELSIHHGSISNCLLGYWNNAGGYLWKFKTK